LSQIVFFSYGGSSAVLPGAARLVSLQLPPRMIGFTATHRKRWEPKRGRRTEPPASCVGRTSTLTSGNASAAHKYTTTWIMRTNNLKKECKSGIRASLT